MIASALIFIGLFFLIPLFCFIQTYKSHNYDAIANNNALIKLVALA